MLRKINHVRNLSLLEHQVNHYLAFIGLETRSRATSVQVPKPNTPAHPAQMATKQQSQVLAMKLDKVEDEAVYALPSTVDISEIQLMECVRLALNYLKSAQSFAANLISHDMLSPADLAKLSMTEAPTEPAGFTPLKVTELKAPRPTSGFQRTQLSATIHEAESL